MVGLDIQSSTNYIREAYAEAEQRFPDDDFARQAAALAILNERTFHSMLGGDDRQDLARLALDNWGMARIGVHTSRGDLVDCVALGGVVMHLNGNLESGLEEIGSIGELDIINYQQLSYDHE